MSKPSKSQHVQDLRLWVARRFTVRDLLADLSLPSTASVADVVDVVSRGQEEIRQMLDTQLPR
ncbi:hypothetical protein ACWGID_31440 [Kribbella sp. NPDC054772]